MPPPNRKVPTKGKVDALEVAERRSRANTIIEEVGQTVRMALVVGGFCFLFWCVKEIVSDLAGKTTDANIVLKLLGNLQISIALAWGAAAAGVLYGYQQRSLRRKTVKHLHARAAERELQIDPERSSSRLTKTGETNPEDAA